MHDSRDKNQHALYLQIVLVKQPDPVPQNRMQAKCHGKFLIFYILPLESKYLAIEMSPKQQLHDSGSVVSKQMLTASERK